MKATYLFKNYLCIPAIEFFYVRKISVKLIAVCICAIASFTMQAQTFNVTNYGAVGNGTADDRDAILKTIKAANTWSFSHSNAQATVYFPSGCYLIKTLLDYNPTNRPRNYVFPIYSNLKYLGVFSGGNTSTIKFDSNLFNATSGGDINLGTGIYANANMFYGYRDTNNNVVSNVVFSKLTIDFNGATNLLPVQNPNDPDNAFGKVKTIYGILFDDGCHDVIIDSLTFKNNPGLNDIVCNAAGQNLTVTNCKFLNGGWNIGSSSIQNSHSTDFSFIYSEWSNSNFVNDSIIQQYPEISLQAGSYSGGIEIHGSNSIARNNYIFGCKPAIYVASANTLSTDFSRDNLPLQNVQVSKNNMLDCYRGVVFYVKNYINNVRIDSNIISTMYLKYTSAFTQAGETVDIMEGILIPKGDLSCRSDYEFNASTPFSNNNLNPINNLNIRSNNISFDVTNSVPPPPGIWTAGMRLHSLQNSQISNDTIRNMNWAGVALEASPWGMNNVSITSNSISDFQLLSKVGPVAGYILVTDNYLPNSDCNPPVHQQTFNNVTITGNSFTGNSTVSTEAACSAPYACFKGIYFSLPNWYAYTSIPVAPYTTNVLKSSTFTISNSYYGYNPGEYFATSPCSSSNTCFNTATAPTDIRWFDILSDNTSTIEQEVDEITGGTIGYCKSTYASKCNIGYRLLGVGNPDINWTITYSDNNTTYTSTKLHLSSIILTRGVDYPLVNNSTGVLTVIATSVGGSKTETRNSSSCLDIGCSYSCTPDITITGTYSNAITKSSTWIKSSLQTTINSTASVKLDANPNNSRGIELKPFSAFDYFLAAPATEMAVFAAQTLDSCGSQVVAKSSPTTQVIESTIGIFPNPSAGSFTVALGMDLQNAQIDLFDTDGRLQKIKIISISSNQVKIVANNLSKGIYFLKIYNKRKTELRKIVIL